MKVIGKYLLNNTYHVFEVRRAIVIFNVTDSEAENAVCAYSDLAEYEIRYQDGSCLTLEAANQLVKQIAIKELTDLDQYHMAFYGIEDVGVPVRNQYDSNAEEVIPLIMSSLEEYDDDDDIE